MNLNGPGRMVLDAWRGLPERFPNIELDACVVMPNHFHGILFAAGVNAAGAPLVGAQSPSADDGWPQFLGQLWQRGYHDHVIRANEALERIREYIINNPVKWDCDPENVDNKRMTLRRI